MEIYNILIVGSGCRESIIAQKLIDDGKKINIDVKIYCIGTNKNKFFCKNAVLYLIDNLSLNNINNCLSNHFP